MTPEEFRKIYEELLEIYPEIREFAKVRGYNIDELFKFKEFLKSYIDIYPKYVIQSRDK